MKHDHAAGDSSHANAREWADVYHSGCTSSLWPVWGYAGSEVFTVWNVERATCLSFCSEYRTVTSSQRGGMFERPKSLLLCRIARADRSCGTNNAMIKALSFSLPTRERTSGLTMRVAGTARIRALMWEQLYSSGVAEAERILGPCRKESSVMSYIQSRVLFPSSSHAV